MKRKITLLTAAAAFAVAALAAAAFGDTSSASALRAPNGALVALRQTGLGKVLVDARGHTLYLFEKDTHGGVPATAPARHTGRRCSAPQSHGPEGECASPCWA